MHAKTDSDATSLAPSSPPRYYVQSPSHDGEKTLTSFHSSPAASPPRHSHSSVGPHSRESQSSRFSGSIKPPKKAGIGNESNVEKGGKKGWKEFGVIEEEELGEYEERRGISRRCLCWLAFLLGFVVLFSFFALVLWGASRSQKPRITVKSITFQNFIIQAGSDASLVPTDMATLNSTVKLTYRNTGTFFGIHVSATPFDLTYDQLVLASGNMKNFYQSRKSQRNVDVVLTGDKVPLYGGGPILAKAPGKSNTYAPIPLKLNFVMKSRAYVLGKLVKPKFVLAIQCNVTMNQNKLNTPVALKDSCIYL